tara:strand:+ start:1775 stop:1930 length:156 start_codon:yes stop_codon:yes gene_type:complete
MKTIKILGYEVKHHGAIHAIIEGAMLLAVIGAIGILFIALAEVFGPNGTGI